MCVVASSTGDREDTLEAEDKKNAIRHTATGQNEKYRARSQTDESGVKIFTSQRNYFGATDLEQARHHYPAQLRNRRGQKLLVNMSPLCANPTRS